MKKRLEESVRTDKEYIRKLLDEFPYSSEDEIVTIYDNERKVLEIDAKISQFIDIQAYRLARIILKGKYKKGYLEKKYGRKDKE